MSDEDLVYSTGSGKQRKNKSKPASAHLPQEGPCKMRLEKKGRGGKQVTVLFNLPFSETAAKELMKKLQGHLACGAAFKDGKIEFRGDMRAKIESYFSKENIKLLRAGG